MIVVVGLSHHTAPIEVREQVALSQEGMAQLVSSLKEHASIAELFVVSTCNRTEVVAVPRKEGSNGLEECAMACVHALCEGKPVATNHVYVKKGLEGVQHLVRVAASLDSLVVGEPQILGQLKQGFEIARRRGAVGPRLHRVMSRVLRGAKRVRNETLIGMGQVSVPSIAVDLARQIFGQLQGHTAALVGAGQMGQTVARLLAQAGANLIVVGRTPERVRKVADRVGGHAREMRDLDAVLQTSDVVVTSTSATQAVITKAEVKAAQKLRRGKHSFLIDLAVPRDVEPDVGDLDGVFLYNIDDLSQVAMESVETRRREAERAAELVETVVRDFQLWSEAEQATPTIKALRAKFRAALHAEYEKSLKGRLKDLSEEQRQGVEKMLGASLNRMLHTATVRLRQEAKTQEGFELEEMSRTLAELFELEEEEVLSGPQAFQPPSAFPGEEADPESQKTQSAEQTAPTEYEAEEKPTRGWG